MKIKRPLFFSLVVLSQLSACGYIKSLFPDKEKDYQYTTEIPALVIPPDLGNNDVLKPAAAMPPSSTDNTDASTPVSDTAPAPNPATDAVAQNKAEPPVTITPLTNEPVIADTPIDEANRAPTASPAVKHEPIPVELVQSAAGAGHLHLGVPFDKAWRAVDKALSRKSIEVTSRNKPEKQFNVHYDADEKKLEDGSLWDEMFFLFKGFQGNEQKFLIKLVENNQQTDVLILDEQQQPSSAPGALHLLKLLLETIKTDFSK